MGKKIYKINTTTGPRYRVGIFDKDELIAPSRRLPRYYKTKKGAEKAFKKVFGGDYD
jgi:hypothetical protein